MLRYLKIHLLLIRNSLIREMNFKANFLLWSLVEVLWFLGQILFVEVLFLHVERIGDWGKWEVVVLVATHQVISQLFQAFCYVNLTQLPELIRTGKLDTLLTLPVDAQFIVSSKQFGIDNLFNSLLGTVLVGFALHKLHITPSLLQILLFLAAVFLGMTVHYSVMFFLSTLTFWIKRAQGLIYAYFNLFNVGRHPDSVFKGAFRFVFSWLVPVILVANVPARILAKPFASPASAALLLAQLFVASTGIFFGTRYFWKLALKRYSSASS